MMRTSGQLRAERLPFMKVRAPWTRSLKKTSTPEMPALKSVDTATPESTMRIGSMPPFQARP